MARYLIQVSLKPEVYATMIKNPQDREEAVRPLFETAGGKLEEYYFAIGENTVYIIAEIPDQTNVGAFCMATLASGAVTSFKATALQTAQEAVNVMKKAAEVAYRPPTS